MEIIIGVLAEFLAMTLALVWIPYFNMNDTANISANQLYHRQRTFSVNLLYALQRCDQMKLYLSHRTAFIGHYCWLISDQMMKQKNHC